MCYTLMPPTRGGANLNNTTTGGQWSDSEESHHINYLELKAVLLGLQSLCKEILHSHIKVMTNNTTAVAYIWNMGGAHSLPYHYMAREIWDWCLTRNIWLTVSHIPGAHNVIADKASRVFDDSKEWKLDVEIFCKVIKHLGTPEIDMFASRLNYQIVPYVSWHPDPQAWAIDAFTLDWSNLSFMLFHLLV